MSFELERTARTLVAPGKGILAADETPATLTRRFDALGIESSAESRRDYRQMLLDTPGIEEFISGAILADETLRQRTSGGAPFASLCSERGILPGIKVDTGAKQLAGHPSERVTEGLDGLRERLAEYRSLGARFAKWRAVFSTSEGRPSAACVAANAHALARYAALCQEQELVPIVEPEVLMEGLLPLERSEEVSAGVLHAVFAQLHEQGVRLEALLLKPSMVLTGASCTKPAPVREVAAATLRCLRRHVPPAVPGVVFLSGGQNDIVATRHLDAINRIPEPAPWRLSFSYGRALQDAALATWSGRAENVAVAQQALYHRARCNSLAALGAYSDGEEQQRVPVSAPGRHVAGAPDAARELR